MWGNVMDNRKKKVNRITAGVLFLIALAGCNPFTSLWFLLGGPEESVGKEFVFQSTREDHEVRIAVICDHGAYQLPSELADIDRLICRKFSEIMAEGFKKNKKVHLRVMTDSKVSAYQRKNREWATEINKMGKDLGVDYIIYFEISHIQLIQPQVVPAMIQGQAAIQTTVYTIDSREDSTNFLYDKNLKDYDITYPDSLKEVENRGTISKLRQEFVEKIALGLSYKFTGASPENHIGNH